MEAKKIGLALSGGGARGLAHIGVLKVLEKAGIPISLLAGTSMGGLVAVTYAAGFSPAEIEDRALRFSHLREFMKLVDLTPQRRGLLEGQKVRNYIREWLGERLTFADLKIPTTLTAVDLLTGSEILLSSGSVLPAVYATIAVPGIFKPVLDDGRILVDGGVLDNLPIQLVKQAGADCVIAVDVHLCPQNQAQWVEPPRHIRWPIPLPEFFNDFYLSELIMVAELTRHQLELNRPEILIEPHISPEISLLFGFHRAKEIIRAGELAAQEKLGAILEAVYD
ncbi:predicted esterase of the alpha-beta hydrolase superfamily [Longilinea arvoryzae]|uniref:Predicted esterase of the alpha-beta hydrolase superfamily n=1 Tax=Longilinea arvoryzae TaxID=360412 RepID=A0A0S7BGJ5_9CHLR|nr:patatin-like phospholipase family protein [Longilinea arvoryzae]GAP14665.1 predicted esterase of the alpha-beta hydrolase superfamily [Longilinea arvoryzae]